MSLDRETLFNLLNSLDESQKDWYILTVVGMIHADGQVLEVEFQYMETFLSKMGITKQRFEDVLKFSQLMMKKFL